MNMCCLLFASEAPESKYKEYWSNNEYEIILLNFVLYKSLIDSM